MLSRSELVSPGGLEPPCRSTAPSTRPVYQFSSTGTKVAGQVGFEPTAVRVKRPFSWTTRALTLIVGEPEWSRTTCARVKNPLPARAWLYASGPLLHSPTAPHTRNPESNQVWGDVSHSHSALELPTCTSADRAAGGCRREDGSSRRNRTAYHSLIGRGPHRSDWLEKEGPTRTGPGIYALARAPHDHSGGHRARRAASVS